jgi:tetratricopeptide (TPR) repeat protein
MSPAMHVTVGSSWATDPMDTAIALAPRYELPIDPWSLRGKGTLTSLDGSGADAKAAVDYQVDGIVSCAPGCGGENAATLKGMLRVRGSATGPAGRWARHGSFRDRTEVTANVPPAGEGEEIRRVSITDDREVTRTELSPAARAARALTASAKRKSDARDWDGAIADLTRAVESDPAYGKAWTARARARLSKKDVPGAVEDANRALALQPKSADALSALASAHAAADDTDAVIADCTRWIEAAPKDARAWTQRARARASKGDTDGAIDDCTQAIEAEPEHADAWWARAQIRLGRQEYAQSIDDWSEVIDLRPRDARAWCNRGNARSANGEFDAAIEDCTKSIALDGKYARAWFCRAIAHGGRGDRERQLADCDRSLELDPAAVNVVQYRASARHDVRDYAGAAADWGRAIELDAKSVEAWLGRAATRLGLGDPAAAIEDCSKAIELDPKSVAAYAQRADARDDAFDAAGAAADRERALAIDPKDARILFAVARSRFRPRMPAAPVVACLREALALGKRLDYGNLWLCLARTQAGDGEAARRDLAAYVATRDAKADAGEDDPWYPQIAAFLAGDRTEDEILAAAASAEGRTKDERTCEAAYYAGVLRALGGDAAKALGLFDRALATGVRTFTEYSDARGWRIALALGAVPTPAPGPEAKPGVCVLAGTDPNGPAARAGLRDGDVVVGIDGRPLEPGALLRRLAETAPGTVLHLDVRRPGESITADVSVGSWASR